MANGNRFGMGCCCGGTGSGGGDFVRIPFCFCTRVPTTLTMVSADPTCNFDMFQSDTILYGPTPPAYNPLNLGPNAFLGTADWPDPVAGGATFRYFLTCQNNQFSLTRIYLTSPYGSPYRDGILYTWLIGAPGNSCNNTTGEFHLDNGIAFPGSDPTCGVTIDGA